MTPTWFKFNNNFIFLFLLYYYYFATYFHHRLCEIDQGGPKWSVSTFMKETTLPRQRENPRFQGLIKNL